MNKNTLKVLGLGAVVAVTLVALRAKQSFKEIKEAFDKEIRDALARPDKTLSEAKEVLNTEVKPEVVKVLKKAKSLKNKLSKKVSKKSKKKV